MTVQPRLGLLLAAFLLLSLGGCGEDPVEVVATSDDLLGTWNITSLMYTPVGGGTSVQSIEPGTSGVITFRADFTYTITFTEVGPPQVTDVEDGMFTVMGSVLTITPDDAPNDPSNLDIQQLTATSATLFQADDEFDFDDDGDDEPATTTVMLQKQ
jgi:hypothetical protein